MGLAIAQVVLFKSLFASLHTTLTESQLKSFLQSAAPLDNLPAAKAVPI
jgi:hypothetical protein